MTDETKTVATNGTNVSSASAPAEAPKPADRGNTISAIVSKWRNECVYNTEITGHAPLINPLMAAIDELEKRLIAGVK